MRKRNPETAQAQAVAVRYRRETDRSPTVVAKGKGQIAQRIKAIAAEHGIPIRQDNDLVELLAEVDIDREIPIELYAAVAEILAWVYRANDALRKDMLS